MESRGMLRILSGPLTAFRGTMSVPASAVPLPAISLELVAAPTLNFALEQSGVPLVEEALVRNAGPAALGPSVLELQLVPELGEPVRVSVPPLPAGEELSLGIIDLNLPAGRLRSVTETERAQLNWALQHEDTVLAKGSVDVEILPYNHWPGARAPLGLLATFVTPNHPVIPELLKDVRALLEKAVGDGSLSGYQKRNPAHVRTQVAALYEALQALDLGYAEVLPSFEKQGQKVRLPDQLLRERMGCCLDLTLLCASALEAMGLSPILILVEGHALPAMWLIDERFPEGVVEDAARLRNLVALGHLLPFDVSTAVSAGLPGFDRAQTVAQQYLAEDARFIAALDVNVLRFDRYRPLPLRTVEVPAPETASPEPAHARIRAILESAAAAPPPTEVKPPTTQDVSRFARWKEKLLDLTLRNRLLNFRTDTRGALPLQVPELASFEDAFSVGEVYELLPLPEEDGRDARAAKLQQTRGMEEELAERRRQDLAKGLLHSSLRQADLWARARHLDRTARMDMEEGGANTLYLAIGMLRWFEEGNPTPRLAPLLLYPAAFRLDRDRKRVRLVREAEEPLGNVTLAEKLKRDYGLDASALTSLELDENGLDVAGILRAVRKAIQSRAGWEVLDEAHVGHFTFTRFLMWKDLEDNEGVLLSNPLVRHIAAVGASTPPVNGKEYAPEHIDDEVPPAELPCVVNTDSTQMAAVASALSGRSFVLQGPPGTGKSQTITQLIAAALERGKTVLFVSEKMAALDVVHRRLKEVGLDDFCLELHSHKSNKKEVLASFARAFERTQHTPEPRWEERSAELGTLREGLNAYVRALHKPWPLGMSLYGATSRLLALRDLPEVRLPLSAPQELTEARFREALAEVDELSRKLVAVRALSSNPWGAVRGLTWSNALEEQLLGSLGEAHAALEGVEKTAAPLAAALGIDVPASTQGLRTLMELGEALSAGPVPSVALLDDVWPDTARQVKAHALALREQSTRESQLASRWKPELFTQELSALHMRFQKWAGAFVLLAFFFLWSARRLLKGLATRELPGNPDIAKDLDTALKVLEQRPRLTEQTQALTDTLRGLSAADLERPEPLEALVQRAAQARELRSTLAVPRVQLPSSPAEREALAARARELRESLDRLARAEESLSGLLKTRPWEPATSAQHRPALRRQLDAWRQGIKALRPWCLYQAQAERLRAMGHGPFVEAVEAQELPPDQVRLTFERAVLSTWTRALQDAEPALREFEGTAHGGRIERFRQLDTEHLSLSRRKVVSALERQLPTGSSLTTETSEPGILARELRKKTRQMALRKLLGSIPNLARRLKPCFLMSPLSVAQYLPAEGQRFDLLVFDEASQIGTHDAIGAIARAGQVIIVGDSKQLPPTAFFTRGDDSEATPDENDIVELESILEEALAKQFPQQMLGWHYRSRHDSLIDFSNRQYYEGRLHVFPAARAHVEDLGIKWHPVPDGVYQSKTQGKTPATNPREAEVLVAELVRSLRRYAPHERTFGVVTFSAVQQQLILDLLDAERARYPELEAHFTSAEPVFVKNLENVQGDERDEILFSICYAKDAAGKMRMSFGPLTWAGGERRLNVAVTRARCALRVFSTLTHDQIDLSRTAAVGARHLREFLRRAKEASDTSAAAAAREPTGTLEQEVATALREMGHTVHTDVGCGGYRVDLAVVHPERPGEYVLGVECDGPHYGSASSARDRDRLRAEVLRGLGWRLYRMWSPDWLEDRQGQLKRLAEAVQHALKASEEEPLAPSLPPVAPSLPPADMEDRSQEAPPSAASSTSAPVSPVKPYVPARLPPVREGADLFAPTSAVRIREQIETVLEQEAPVHEELLARRILEAWGLTKLTPRVRARLEEQLEHLSQRGVVLARGEFLWWAARAPEQYTEFRGAHEEREASQFPPEEVANAAASVLAQALSLGKEDLCRETGRLFGVQRLTRTVLPVLEAGLQHLERAGRCTFEGERVVWKR
jgi:very-short-patch-repair endonuclease